MESAKQRAQRALRVYVLMCLRPWRAYVLGVLTCLACLHAYVLTCLLCLRVYVRACYDKMFYFLTCLRAWCAFLSYLLYISILQFKNSHSKKMCALLTSRKNAFCILQKIEVPNVTETLWCCFYKRQSLFEGYRCINDSIGEERGSRTTILFLWEKNCLLQKPVWCNVRYPTCIEACKTVVEQDIRRVVEEFELPILNEI